LDMNKVAKLGEASADANAAKKSHKQRAGKDSAAPVAAVPTGMQSQQQILARAFANAVAEEDFEASR
jgi:hypothetical protein